MPSYLPQKKTFVCHVSFPWCLSSVGPHWPPVFCASEPISLAVLQLNKNTVCQIMQPARYLASPSHLDNRERVLASYCSQPDIWNFSLPPSFQLEIRNTNCLSIQDIWHFTYVWLSCSDINTQNVYYLGIQQNTWYFSLLFGSPAEENRHKTICKQIEPARYLVFLPPYDFPAGQQNSTKYMSNSAASGISCISPFLYILDGLNTDTCVL